MSEIGEDGAEKRTTGTHHDRFTTLTTAAKIERELRAAGHSIEIPKEFDDDAIHDD